MVAHFGEWAGYLGLYGGSAVGSGRSCCCFQTRFAVDQMLHSADYMLGSSPCSGLWAVFLVVKAGHLCLYMVVHWRLVV